MKGASRRPLDPIEGVDNLPDPVEDLTPKKLKSAVSKRNLTPDTINNKK